MRYVAASASVLVVPADAFSSRHPAPVPEDIEKHIGSMLLECKSLGRLEMLLTVPRCCEISEPAAKTEARMRVFEELVNIVGGYVKMMEELSGRCIRFNTVCSSRKDDEGIDWRVVSGYRAGRGA